MHIFDIAGVQPDAMRIRAMKDFRVPKSGTDVRSFAGLCSYVRRFLKNIAEVVGPLASFLKKYGHFSWGPCQAAAFSDFTAPLTTAPIQAHFNPSASTELRTDATGYGIGALLAEQQRGDKCVTPFATRLLRNENMFGQTLTVVSDHQVLVGWPCLRPGRRER